MTAKSVKKMGRPVLPKGEVKDFQIGVRFNQHDAKVVREAVARSGMKSSDWARERLVYAARH